MYCIDDVFFEDIDEYIQHCEWTREDVELFDDSFNLVASVCTLQPLHVFTPDNITQSINQERFSEDECEYDIVVKALIDCVDFKKLNSMVPELWYPTHQKETFSKQDLMNANFD